MNDDLQGRVAGFGSRAVAITVDGIIILLIPVLSAGFIHLIMGLFTNISIDDKAVETALGLALAVPVVGFVYYTFFFWVTGKTPGKALMGIKVVRYDGGRVKFLRAALRTVCYSLSALAFGLGFAWVLIDNRRMAWHDKIAGTFVIYDWEATAWIPHSLRPDDEQADTDDEVDTELEEAVTP